MHSSLVSGVYIAESGNYARGRSGYKICKITIHQMAGRLTGKQCAVNIFGVKGRKASANYCIGYDGDIVCNVEEENRAYTSSSAWNDNQAITIEVSNDANGSDRITEASWRSLVALCKDICKRYNFPLIYTGDKNGSLTKHCFYANTSCPGKYLGGRFPELCDAVNNGRGGSMYLVGQRVLIDAPIGENIPNTDKVKVKSNGYEFVIHKSIAKVYGLGEVVKVIGNGLYRVKIFDDEFDCREEYMTDKF